MGNQHRYIASFINSVNRLTREVHLDYNLNKRQEGITTRLENSQANFSDVFNFLCINELNRLNLFGLTTGRNIAGKAVRQHVKRCVGMQSNFGCNIVSNDDTCVRYGISNIFSHKIEASPCCSNWEHSYLKTERLMDEIEKYNKKKMASILNDARSITHFKQCLEQRFTGVICINRDLICFFKNKLVVKIGLIAPGMNVYPIPMSGTFSLDVTQFKFYGNFVALKDIKMANSIVERSVCIKYYRFCLLDFMHDSSCIYSLNGDITPGGKDSSKLFQRVVLLLHNLEHMNLSYQARIISNLTTDYPYHTLKDVFAIISLISTSKMLKRNCTGYLEGKIKLFYAQQADPYSLCSSILFHNMKFGDTDVLKLIEFIEDRLVDNSGFMRTEDLVFLYDTCLFVSKIGQLALRYKEKITGNIAEKDAKDGSSYNVSVMNKPYDPAGVGYPHRDAFFNCTCDRHHSSFAGSHYVNSEAHRENAHRPICLNEDEAGAVNTAMNTSPLYIDKSVQCINYRMSKQLLEDNRPRLDCYSDPLKYSSGFCKINALFARLVDLWRYDLHKYINPADIEAQTHVPVNLNEALQVLYIISRISCIVPVKISFFDKALIECVEVILHKFHKAMKVMLSNDLGVSSLKKEVTAKQKCDDVDTLRGMAGKDLAGKLHSCHNVKLPNTTSQAVHSQNASTTLLPHDYTVVFDSLCGLAKRLSDCYLRFIMIHMSNRAMSLSHTEIVKRLHKDTTKKLVWCRIIYSEINGFYAFVCNVDQKARKYSTNNCFNVLKKPCYDEYLVEEKKVFLSMYNLKAVKNAVIKNKNCVSLIEQTIETGRFLWFGDMYRRYKMYLYETVCLITREYSSRPNLIIKDISRLF